MSNHLYLQVVGDGDPHTVIRPETVAPCTPTELLEQILARDDTPTSATTMLRQLSDPAVRLHDAVQRYIDGLCRHAESPSGAMASWLAAKCVSAATSKLTSNGAPGHRDHVGFVTPARTGTDGQAHITSLETEPASLERSRLAE